LDSRRGATRDLQKLLKKERTCLRLERIKAMKEVGEDARA
jgi:hypothetical protein